MSTLTTICTSVRTLSAPGRVAGQVLPQVLLSQHRHITGGALHWCQEEPAIVLLQVLTAFYSSHFGQVPFQNVKKFALHIETCGELSHVPRTATNQIIQRERFKFTRPVLFPFWLCAGRCCCEEPCLPRTSITLKNTSMRLTSIGEICRES